MARLHPDNLSMGAGVLFLSAIPFWILSLGYLPVDDALRHAGKAMTDRSWSEILVVRPEITMDSHPGWHFVLRTIRTFTAADALDLVVLSVALLFLAVALMGLAFRQRPAAWMASILFVFTFDPDVVLRWTIGRPFLLSTATLLALVFTWERGAMVRGARDATFWILTFALVSWIHPSFYLFVLPVVSLVLAGRRNDAVSLGAVCFTGSLLGAALTGHPVDFYRQAILHPVVSLGKGATTLVGEFQPGEGSPLLVLAAVLLLNWLRGGEGLASLRTDPTALLVTLGWSLSFVNKRFWVDWGGPALVALLTREIAQGMDKRLGSARMRLAATLAFSSLLALSLCADRAGRWSRLDSFFAPLARPEKATFLPDPGGILYSDSMYVFYSVFARLPQAPFRYVLGFEAGWMREEDERVYRDASRVGLRAMRPWVAKMRPKDRLILSANGSEQFPELEWRRATVTLWSGRLPTTTPANQDPLSR